MESIAQLNNETNENINFFVSCISDSNKELREHTQCLTYLDPSNIKKIEKAKYNEWKDIYYFK
jgi:hypothetical protein